MQIDGKQLMDASVTPAKLTDPSGAVLTQDDKEITASVTTSDGDQAFAGSISNTPADDCYVGVMINGAMQVLGDGVKTKDCYFSNDGGTTARSISAIASGDTLHWNGTVAGYELAATDTIDLLYEV